MRAAWSDRGRRAVEQCTHCARRRMSTVGRSCHYLPTVPTEACVPGEVATAQETVSGVLGRPAAGATLHRQLQASCYSAAAAIKSVEDLSQRDAYCFTGHSVPKFSGRIYFTRGSYQQGCRRRGALGQLQARRGQGGRRARGPA